MNKQEKKEVIVELKDKFGEARKEIGFKSELKELDGAFFVTDHILHEGFVSEDFSRQMCSRIRDTLNVWANYLHSLLMPNPQHLINITEAKLFDEGDRKEIQVLIKGALALNRLNTLCGLTKDKKMEAEFIDGAMKFWNEKYKPGIVKIMKKVNKGWSE
ncbi:MAG: hypothetical protein ABH864_06145 [archaeon]